MMQHLWRERHIQAPNVVERVVFPPETSTIRLQLERGAAEQGSEMMAALE